jgi:hypothetical protein
MADDLNKPKHEAPPKLDWKKNGALSGPPEAPQEGAPAPAAPKKQTTRVDLTTAQEAASAVQAKKQTSRLPLETAVPPPAGQALAGTPPGIPTAPKTIRLQRPPQATTVSAFQAPPAAPSSATDKIGAKKMTSRIPLEAALTPEEAPAAAPAAGTATTPRTIRIKRPTPTGVEAGAKVAPPPAEAADVQATVAKAKSQTAKIEEMPEALAEISQPTQRKTIKIRRPDSMQAALSRPPEGLAPAAAAVAAPEAAVFAAPAEGKPLWNAIFAVAGIAAIIVICVLIYVLATQALPGAGFRLPGQI